MTYSYLAKGRSEQELIQLDVALAPGKKEAEERIDEANMRAMQALQSMLPSKGTK